MKKHSDSSESQTSMPSQTLNQLSRGASLNISDGGSGPSLIFEPVLIRFGVIEVLHRTF